MLRFWMFAGEDYYPRGGIDDLAGKFASMDDAVPPARIDWAHLVDIVTGQRWGWRAGRWAEVADE